MRFNAAAADSREAQEQFCAYLVTCVDMEIASHSDSTAPVSDWGRKNSPNRSEPRKASWRRILARPVK